MSSGPWIKMRTELLVDPRVDAMADMLGVNRAVVIGGLFMVWAAADSQTVDGFFKGGTVGGIDRRAELPGFGRAMVSVGWLEEVDGGVQLPRFTEHQETTTFGRKLKETTRKAEYRKRVPSLSRDCPAQNAPQERDIDGTLSTLSSVSRFSGSKGESEGEKPPTFNPNTDGIRISHVFRAYPKLGRVESGAAQDAIREAVEWIIANRPDITDPLAFLQERTEAYARSPIAQTKFVLKAANWYGRRSFFDPDEAWQRDDGKPKALDMAEFDRLQQETEARNARLKARNGNQRSQAVH